jgi:tetratricopeptide (TPR) repeat protein
MRRAAWPVLALLAAGCGGPKDAGGDGGGKPAETVDAVWLRGMDHYQKKEYDKAIPDFTEAIRLDPKFAPAYRDRGSSYSRLKEYDKAVADLTEYIRLKPEDPEGYEFRVLAYNGLKDAAKASADLRMAEKLRGKKP